MQQASRTSRELILSLCANGISAVEFAQPSHDSAAAWSKCFHASVCFEHLLYLLSVKINEEVGRITEDLDVGEFYDFNLHLLYCYFVLSIELLILYHNQSIFIE